MNVPAHQTAEQPAGRKPTAVIAPHLSAELRANYENLHEDLREANELAAALELQLAGKSKEAMHLKFLFEQTRSHLGHMQDSIVAMRKERHHLANEAMRAMRLDTTLGLMTADRDRLKRELDTAQESLAAERAKHAQPPEMRDKRDDRIAELTFEVMKLRRQVAELRGKNAPAAETAPGEPQEPVLNRHGAR